MPPLCDCEQVQSALEDMMKAECPAEILATEGTSVKYFKDFEGDNSQVSAVQSNLREQTCMCKFL